MATQQGVAKEKGNERVRKERREGEEMITRTSPGNKDLRRKEVCECVCEEGWSDGSDDWPPQNK